MFEIARKDLLQSFKDKKGLLLSFLLPIVLIALFSLVYGGFQSSSKDRAQSLLFCDDDQSVLSHDLLSELEAEKGLKLTIKPLSEAETLVINGDFPSALLIYKGFEDSINQGKSTPVEFIYDESRELEMGLTQKALMSTLMPFLGEQGSKSQVHSFINDKYGDEMPEEMIAEIHDDIDQQFSPDQEETSVGTSSIESRAVSVKEDMPWGLIQAFAGTSVMMLLFSITGMGSSIIKERDTGTLKRILYSPIKPWQIILGKFGSGFVFAMIQMSILVLFAWLAFGLDIFRNFSGLILLVFATAMAVSGFGILIASLARSQKQVESLSLIIILVMSALGGSMMPLFLFPEIIKTVAHFTINYWAIDGFYDVLGRDVGLMGIMQNTLMLLLFSILSSIIAIFVFNKRLKKDF
ncbi:MULTISPECIES: ABC transporter permease [unclassified Lentimicrobium]|uniref:ABC transporter permease n=1 Tax=unclassified Lentimicrobium TaxID=2677434 RepID=UPI0015559A1A|nr:MULTISPECIES: ABC transporter permease [unclassified Lentimicrobium]NPD44536.1 ABC transporter permease [Lentimicrobium sp. S6]NPD85647.1 ABC transporter permease [Lentimicrobium sp. L6]